MTGFNWLRTENSGELYVTSCRQRLSDTELRDQPTDNETFNTAITKAPFP